MVSTRVGDTPTIIDGPPIGPDPPKSKFCHFGPRNVSVGRTESRKLFNLTICTLAIVVCVSSHNILHCSMMAMLCNKPAVEDIVGKFFPI